MNQNPKRDALESALEGAHVFVHLDPRRPGVVVPGHLRGLAPLVLQLSHGFAVPMRDLAIDDFGVRCTLTFNRSPFHCVLPWASVYAVVDGTGVVSVWPESLPEELRPPGERGPKPASPRPALRVIRGGGS